MAISTISSSGLDGNVSQLGKNLLINGEMLSAQRGDLTGVGGSNAYVSADMWEVRRSAGTEEARVSTSVESLSKDNSILLGGHRYALKIDCTTAESAVGSAEVMFVCTKIEAQNLQHLLYGSEGSQQAMSLRFGFSSPKSGTHCIALYSPDGNRSLVREFTVAAADTFEIIKIDNIPGDALGTMNNDNGEGLRLAFPLFAGSAYHDTNNTWEANEAASTSNQQNLLDNTSNNIFITGVQLEVGLKCTDFEYEPHSVTLAKCQRYLVAIGDTNGGLGVRVGMAAVRGGTTIFDVVVPHPVSMRAAPTYSGELDWPQGVFRGVGRNGTGGSITASITATRFNVTGASSLTIADAGYYDYRGSHGGFLSAEL